MPQTKESLYEQLNPLTTIAGQHFVEDFSGDTLDTFRWYTGNSTGGTVAMSDSVNGGVILDTGGTQVRTEINLQNIRLTNIMIGILIVGPNHMKKKGPKKVKLESCL